jgi:hypothetical protein
MQSFGLEKLLLFTCKPAALGRKGLPGLRSRALGLNDLARRETYVCLHLREISKRRRISSVLINGIIAKRRTSIDASDAELKKVASYAEKNDANIFQA